MPMSGALVCLLLISRCGFNTLINGVFNIVINIVFHRRRPCCKSLRAALRQGVWSFAGPYGAGVRGACGDSVPEWAVLRCETGRIEMPNGPFHNAERAVLCSAVAAVDYA